MTHLPTSSHRTPRTLATLAASIALIGGLTSACMDMDMEQEGGETLALQAFDCGRLKVWNVGVPIEGSELVQHQGGVFASVLQGRYTVAAANWAPPLASLWRPAGTCGGQAQPPAPQKPQPPAPAPQDPAPAPQKPQDPPPVDNSVGNRFAPNNPANFNQLTCKNANNVQQVFDTSGGKNVGNRRGAQFITGRCTADSDCNSGFCSFPCGVCSGKDVRGAFNQPIAGKTGSGFTCPPGTEGRTCGQASPAADGR